MYVIRRFLEVTPGFLERGVLCVVTRATAGIAR